MLGRLRVAALLTWPALALVVLVAIPVVLLLRISLAPPDPNGLWSAGATLDAYRGLMDRSFAAALLYSLGLALLVAAAGVGLGFPLTFFITRMRRGWQVLWLVFLLTTLTLSDVLIAFSWQVMLSKRIGLPTMLVNLGLMDQADSLTPSGGAVLANLIYLVLPFTVLMLYPTMSQLAPELLEAARTLGASPFVAFRAVVVPATKRSAALAFVISAVLTLGAYVAPVVLGRPRQWTLAVLISNAALAGHNIPRAAAMSVCLLLAALLLTGGTIWIARRRGAR
ncbi:MAG: putative spermidine/putrescine transport system permease protein [Gammaproteobacteria bacterium]|jgi:putative spermidine/putrescine transport system permease protein|nr:putative spermidine/putrescine transport system permease protein [Gammaproteobacteria bacterium]